MNDEEQRRATLLGQRSDVFPLPYLRWVTSAVGRKDRGRRTKRLYQQWQVNKYNQGELVSTSFLWRPVESVKLEELEAAHPNPSESEK